MASPLENPDDPRQPRLLFLTARPEEHDSLLETYEFERHLHQNHPYFRLAHNQWDVRVTHTGTGAEQTRLTLNRLEGLLEPDFVLVSGTAGSLSPDLERDSVYLPTAVRKVGTDKWLHPETEIMQWLMSSLRESSGRETTFRSGPMVTVDEPVTDPDAREKLRRENQALAVDMESAVIVNSLVLDRTDQPDWGIVRVISDTPEDASLRTVKDQQTRAANRNGQLLSDLLSSILER